MCKNCSELLHIVYNGEKYHVIDFILFCHQNGLDFDKEIENCDFDYRNQNFSFKEYQEDLIENSQKFLADSNSEYLFSPERLVGLNSKIFIAMSFLSNLSEKITIANHYSLQSYFKISDELHGTSSYRGFYFQRYCDFCSAVMWYNSCFDTLLQIFCVKFSLYKDLGLNARPKITKQFYWKNIKEYYQLCDYRKVKNIVSTKKNKELLKWWSKIEECRTTLEWIRINTNSLKHKTGIFESELNFGDITNFILKFTKKADLYEQCEIDIDDDYYRLIEAHNSIVEVYSFMICFYKKEIDKRIVD